MDGCCDVCSCEYHTLSCSNPEVIELTGNSNNSTVTNFSNLSDLMGTSTKPSSEGSKDSADDPSREVTIVLLKPACGSTICDADVGTGEHSTSTNLSDYDCDMLTSPKLAAGYKDSGDNDPSGEAVIDPTKRAVRFNGSAAVMADDDPANNDDNEKMTDFQQKATNNTSTNAVKSSFQLAVLNKSIIPSRSFANTRLANLLLLPSNT